MSDADSPGEGVYPNAVTARLTNQTYEQLETYAEEHTEGRITVAAREVIEDSLERNDDTDTDTTTSNLSRADVLLLFGGLLSAGVLAGHFSPGQPHIAAYAAAGLLVTLGLYYRWVSQQ
jgi:hypothetical protein